MPHLYLTVPSQSHSFFPLAFARLAVMFRRRVGGEGREVVSHRTPVSSFVKEPCRMTGISSARDSASPSCFYSPTFSTLLELGLIKARALVE
jgi:hypothetical protein